MAKTIDYYFSPMSPWTYLGHARFADTARRHGVTIAPKPVDFARIFAVSGGLPVPKRAPQRQAYRLIELARWRDYLGMPMTIQPRFFPYDPRLACLAIIAAGSADQAMTLAGALMRACWADEMNMADESALATVIQSVALDSDELIRKAATPEIAARHDAFTDEAIALQVFGAPTYVYRNELFWGQDRIEFLDRALAKVS